MGSSLTSSLWTRPPMTAHQSAPPNNLDIEMSNPAPTPKLSPEFCFSTNALRDFLRISRAIDDSITPNLNALIPSSPAFASAPYPRAPQPRQIPSSVCEDFKENILFPSWNTRSYVLDYCAGVAESDDLEDPEYSVRQADSARNEVKVVDERTDPYSGRYFPKESRTEILAQAVRQERSVEAIVRARTWKLIGERCGDDSRGKSWESVLKSSQNRH